jgi:lipoyl-dependent peroxiredoxin
MKRKASAVWKGTGLEGAGHLNTTSGALSDLPYSTKMRFQDEEGRSGTNPEELIAAAHAGCFTMALSFQITGAGYTPDELRTDAVITMEKDPEGTGWTIHSSDLTLRGRVPGISGDEFQRLAEAAKAGCPVSRALSIEIRLDAKLES